LGDAVLADIGRAGVFALKFWNRGLSQIVAKQPISSIEDIRGLRMGTWSDAPASPFLAKLGADLIPVNSTNMSAALANGTVEAAVLEPQNNEISFWTNLNELKSQVYVTDFQPLVGVLVISPTYWSGLSEAEQQAWRRAVNDASKQSISQIQMTETIDRKVANAKVVIPNREQKVQLLVAGGWSAARAQSDLNSVENEKAYIRATHVDIKKKKN